MIAVYLAKRGFRVDVYEARKGINPVKIYMLSVSDYRKFCSTNCKMQLMEHDVPYIMFMVIIAHKPYIIVKRPFKDKFL